MQGNVKTKEMPIEAPVKAVTVMHESKFWEEDDPRWKMTGLGEEQPLPQHKKGCHIIDMGADSYIWCFTGWRGSGKTTSMTYYAMKCNYLYGTRLISNYEVDYILKRIDGTSERIKAEPLDIYRLLSFEGDYIDCLILMDEAPDIVSHLASQTWKNRLLNVFIRQLRKNHNSLFMGAQQFELIDKSMRWQTDILARCEDASRKYGWPSSERGKCLLVHLLDNSGMWTGKTWEQQLREGRFLKEIGSRHKLTPCVLWGDECHKAVFDTYEVQDIWESCRKVDIHLMKYDVGRVEAKPGIARAIIDKARPAIDHAMQLDGQLVWTKGFYSDVGAVTAKEKDQLSKLLSSCNVRVGADHSGKRYYDFSEFDYQQFIL